MNKHSKLALDLCIENCYFERKLNENWTKIERFWLNEIDWKGREIVK